MKSISGVLNVVLLLAVAVLYYLHFSSEKVDSSESSEGSMLSIDNPTIVYVNSDSLLANYVYLKDKQEDLKAKSEQLNNEYKNRAQGLQTEVNNYQQNANNMTIGQARAVEEDLVKKQQNLKLYEQSLTQELLNEEAKINQELYDKVSSFLKEYGEQNELHLVVKYNPGSDVLYANEGMDITNEVIVGLNDAYNNMGGQTEDSDSTSVN